MSLRDARLAVVGLGLVLLLLTSGCSESPYAPSGANALNHAGGSSGSRSGPSCAARFNRLLRAERNNNAVDGADMNRLGNQCPGRYAVLVDYRSLRSMARAGAGGACSEYAAFDVEREAVRLAARDGLCTGSPAAPRPSAPATATWQCHYSPTYNNDWHDDAVCTNGSETERPYLREWDSFVTEAEIMESAREFERQRNGR